MNAERVESLFDGVQEAFISEIRNLKYVLVKEFDASEKLKELNEKSELKKRQLAEENESYKIKEKQLKNDMTIARSLIEDKDKLIKVLDPTGVGQRLIHSFNAEEIEKLKERTAELKSKEKDLLETISKLESEKTEQVTTIDKLRNEVSTLKDRQAIDKDCMEKMNKKIDNYEAKDKTQLKSIDELKSQATILQSQLNEYAQKVVPKFEAEISLLKEENRKLKADQSAKKKNSNDENNGSKRKAVSPEGNKKRLKASER